MTIVNYDTPSFFLIFLIKKCPRLRTLLVTVPFNLTVKILLFIGKAFHLSYNAVNIIIWYMIFPMFWMAILDYKLTPDSFCSHMAITVLRTRLCTEKEIQPLLRFVIQVGSRIYPFFWQLLLSGKTPKGIKSLPEVP